MPPPNSQESPLPPSQCEKIHPGETPIWKLKWVTETPPPSPPVFSGKSHVPLWLGGEGCYALRVRKDGGERKGEKKKAGTRGLWIYRFPPPNPRGSFPASYISYPILFPSFPLTHPTSFYINFLSLSFFSHSHFLTPPKLPLYQDSDKSSTPHGFGNWAVLLAFLQKPLLKFHSKLLNKRPAEPWATALGQMI